MHATPRDFFSWERNLLAVSRCWDPRLWPLAGHRALYRGLVGAGCFQRSILRSPAKGPPTSGLRARVGEWAACCPSGCLYRHQRRLPPCAHAVKFGRLLRDASLCSVFQPRSPSRWRNVDQRPRRLHPPPVCLLPSPAGSQCLPNPLCPLQAEARGWRAVPSR